MCPVCIIEPNTFLFADRKDKDLLRFIRCSVVPLRCMHSMGTRCWRPTGVQNSLSDETRDFNEKSIQINTEPSITPALSAAALAFSQLFMQSSSIWTHFLVWNLTVLNVTCGSLQIRV